MPIEPSLTPALRQVWWLGAWALLVLTADLHRGLAEAERAGYRPDHTAAVWLLGSWHHLICMVEVHSPPLPSLASPCPCYKSTASFSSRALLRNAVHAMHAGAGPYFQSG